MGTPPVTWEGAHRSFLLHLKATNKAPKTVRYYQVQILQLIKWTKTENISLEEFGKRFLDEYLGYRRWREASSGRRRNGSNGGLR